MTTGHSHSIKQSVYQRLPIIRQLPRWGKSLSAGMTRSIDLNREWFKAYITIGAVVSVSHLYLTSGGFTQIFAVEFIIAVLALPLVWLLIGYARKLHARNRKRLLGNVLILLVVFGSLFAITIPLLSLSDLVAASLYAASIAWLIASVFMTIILIFLATAFNSDFAHLQMFRRWTLRLQSLAGLFLFAVGAQQLLLWPTSLSSHLPSVEFFDWLVESSVPIKLLPDPYVDIFGTGLILFILLLAIIGLYRHLARRLFAPRLGFFRLAFQLLRDNLRYRFTRKGRLIWPVRPNSDRDESMEDPTDSLHLEEFVFVTSLAAVSLAFGFWVPRAVPQGMASLVHPEASSLLAYVIIVFFLAGGVDIWVRAIEVAGSNGIFYTFGLWLGTLSVYWPTAIIAVSVISDVSLLSTRLFTSDAQIADVQDKFTFWYRAALGAITVLIALGRSRRLAAHHIGNHRTFRYGLAAVSLLVLLSFVVNATPKFPIDHLPPGPSELQPIIEHIQGSVLGTEIYAFAALVLAIIVAAITLYGGPFRRNFESIVPVLGAQLIASPSIAIAPLLFNERIKSAQWSDDGFWDLAIKDVGVAPQNATLRVYVAGSEEEVASEALSKPHARLRDPFDFILTDLRTAIKIIGAENAASKGKTQYRIIYVAATIPWIDVDVRAPNDDDKPQGMILDSGYLRFISALGESIDRQHLGYLDEDRCRPAAIATVAYYAAFNSGDVDEVYLCEPYYSWLARHHHTEHLPLYLDPKSERQVVYVLLARHHDGVHPAVSYNWRRTLCEMFREGQQAAQENKGVVNHAHLHRLSDFLHSSVGGGVRLHLEDIHFALCRSNFEPTFAYSSPEELELAFDDLKKSKLISSTARRKLMTPNPSMAWDERILQAFSQTSPSVSDDVESALAKNKRQLYPEGFFKHFYGTALTAEQSGPSLDALSYLHSMATVALPDNPGEIATLLSELKIVVSKSESDLALIATANLGDSALVYLINRVELPPPDVLIASLGKPIMRGSHTAAWINSLRKAKFDANEIKAFMIPVLHQPGSLFEVINKLRGRPPDEGINIEQVFAFPVTDDIALALLVIKQKNWGKAYSALSGNSPLEAPQAQHIEKMADDIVLVPRWRHHENHVIFKHRLEGGISWEVEFQCRSLATWTPSWGNIANWHAEVRFDEVRLKIPTTLAWQILILAKIGRIPWVGLLLKQKLRERVPGIADFDEYRDLKNWWMRVTPKTEHG